MSEHDALLAECAVLMRQHNTDVSLSMMEFSMRAARLLPRLAVALAESAQRVEAAYREGWWDRHWDKDTVHDAEPDAQWPVSDAARDGDEWRRWLPRKEG